jgi:hypothetical protein
MPNTLANWIYQINQQNKAELDETMKGVAQAVGSVIQANAEKARVMQDINSSNEISKLHNPNATPIGYDEQTGMATKDPNTNIQVNKIMGEYQSKLLTAQKDYPNAGVDWNKTNRLTIDSDIATAKANKTNQEFDLKSTTIGEAGQARYSELIGKGLPRSAAYDLASDTAKTEDKAQLLGSKFYPIFQKAVKAGIDPDIAFGDAKNAKDEYDAKEASKLIQSRQNTPQEDLKREKALNLDQNVRTATLYYKGKGEDRTVGTGKNKRTIAGGEVIYSLPVEYDGEKGWIFSGSGEPVNLEYKWVKPLTTLEKKGVQEGYTPGKNKAGQPVNTDMINGQKQTSKRLKFNPATGTVE